jgi:hypothetical protein
MNFLNNMMGVVAPITTGYIVGATQSFTGAFLVAGIVLVIGIVAYVFILGRLEPIADPLTARAAGSGAARPLRRIPAIVSFLNPQPALSLVGGNRSSCPITATRRHHPERLRWVDCGRSRVAAPASIPDVRAYRDGHDVRD